MNPVSQITELRSQLRGEVILSGDQRYENVRMVWNGTVDRHPSAIIQCADTHDIQHAVVFARQNNLEIAVRGGGHASAGYATTDGGLVIDLSLMKSITADPAGRTATVQPGATLGELITSVQRYGLVTPTGSLSDVGISGLTLGGGIGPLTGKFGLTSDNVLSFEVVTADGKVQRAAIDENPDLYWALRGGGGNFGIAASFEFRLHPLSTVFGGAVQHPLSRVREVLQFYRDFSADMPDDLAANCAILTLPNGTPVITIGVCYSGDLTEGDGQLVKLRGYGHPLADLIQPMPYPRIFSMLDPIYRRGRCYATKGGGITRLPDDLIDALAASAEKITSPYSHILILPVHGAASRVDPAATAFAYRQKHYEVMLVSAWEDHAEAKHVRWLNDSWQTIQPFIDSLGYLNWIADEGPERVRAAYGSNYARLAALKRRYDPLNLFHLNQNILPAPTAAQAGI